MPNIGSVLRMEISRLSRKEIREHTESTRKATVQHRRDIALLKREMAALERQVKALARGMRAATPEPEAEAPRVRFSAQGLRSHRQRLGLSASDFGKLVGVTGQSVYNWENGSTVPRGEQLTRLASVRSIGKRVAMQRLEEASAAPKRSPRKR
jgi:DNA-binding transcriptional regulator YiaG